MAHYAPIGIENFDEVIQQNCFYVDKTEFIKNWWESKSKSTLITRPRRFGKTLTMSMLKCFFCVQYANREDLFQNLKIWQYEEFRKLQGTYPVIFLSFADIQDGKIEFAIQGIKEKILGQYSLYYYIKDSPLLSDIDKKQFQLVQPEMNDRIAVSAINLLCNCLYKYYKKNPIILLDEYDTPMITAYNKGYWEELADFMRSFFNATFKTNLYLEKSLMTGITRVAKESIFSGLNNLKVVSTTSPEYADTFGFTEAEVFTAMNEQGKTEEEKLEVKRYYDGFTFGNSKEIYNPWSIINYLDTGMLEPYWANTASHEMIEDLIHRSVADFKCDLQKLISNESITVTIDENINFNTLYTNPNSAWSLLLAAGYLKVEERKGNLYTLTLTNYEVRMTFEGVIKNWISHGNNMYGEFVQALLDGNIEDMNEFLSSYLEEVAGFFDTGGRIPEKFYHGFCLGMVTTLHNDYIIYSNRKSGRGRADLLLYRKDNTGDGIIIEFKALNEKAGEEKLADTVHSALKQIADKHYDVELKRHGFTDERIKKYGIAFSGQEVLVGDK